MTNKLRFRLLAVTALSAACLATTVLGGQTQSPSPAGDISGKWHFVFATEGGDREFDATFKLDGDKVTGKWGGDADVKGTFSAGKLSLEFPVNSEEAGAGTLKIDGQLADDALTGNWAFQSYDGTFKATRPKPAVS